MYLLNGLVHQAPEKPGNVHQAPEKPGNLHGHASFFMQLLYRLSIRLVSVEESFSVHSVSVQHSMETEREPNNENLKATSMQSWLIGNGGLLHM